jgi:glycosyltransferase involved in cell wall biosynthesis
MWSLPSCEIFNLHWIAGFIDYQAFFSSLDPHMPIVWTLHDMNAFTGGCHYDYGCGKYTEQCGACPQLGSNDKSDLSRRIWSRKRKSLGRIDSQRLHIVTPSRCLASQAKRSSLLGHFPVSVIPYGLDTDVFSPRDRSLARNALELPQDAYIILFVAVSAATTRKGLTFLVKTLGKLAEMIDLHLISVGEERPNLDIQIPHLHLGHIDNDRLLSLVYSASDLFVIPSLQDNLPNTVLEAMACGTPVVAFDIGGIPDMIQPDFTGSLVPLGDTTTFCEKMIHLLKDKALRSEMSDNCRRVALQNYDLSIQARGYVRLYSQMLQNRLNLL